MLKSAALPLAGFLGIIAVSLPLSPAVAARSLEALQSPDPARETAARADAGFAASCRAAARELLGKGSFTFGRPAYTSRGGEAIVRMDVGVPGLAQDGLFRAVCVRGRQGGTVEAAIFDAPANDIGPRVIALAGPTGGGPPAAPDYVIGYNPSEPSGDVAYGGVYGGGYGDAIGGYGAAFGGGWAGGWKRFCPTCRPFVFERGTLHRALPGALTFIRRQPGPVLRGGPKRPVHVAPRTGFQGVVRLGMGGFVR